MIRRDLLKSITAVMIASLILAGCGNEKDEPKVIAGTEPVTEASMENKTEDETKGIVATTTATDVTKPTEKTAVTTTSPENPTENLTQPATAQTKSTEEETKKGHWEEVIVVPEYQELVTPAWTEKKNETERVLKREAWTETIEHPAEYVEFPNVRCIGVQAVLHTDWDELSQQWYEHWVDEWIYEDFIDKVMVKEPWTETIQHSAVYEDVTKEVEIEHPAVYRTVPAVTKMVWVED